MSNSGTEGWNEWSRHILSELKRLNTNYESLRAMNEEIKTELTKLSGLEEGIGELKAWKTRIDEIASPSQLEEMSKDVQSLKNFKTIAITVWAVFQGLTAIGISLLKLI